MKKIISAILMLTLILSSNLCIASADTSVTASYDSEKGLICLSGNAMGKTNITMLPFGVSVSEVGKTTEPLELRFMNAYGKYVYKFPVPEGIADGKYVIWLTDNHATVSADFMYFDPINANRLVDELNTITDSADYVSFICENAPSLGFDTTSEVYKQNIDRASEMLFKENVEFSDSIEFNSVLEKYLSIADFGGKTADEADKLLSDYASLLGIDYSADYKSNPDYSNTERTALCRLLTLMDYNTELNEVQKSKPDADFADVFENLGILAKIKSASGYVALRDVYENYLSDVTQNCNGYANVPSKSVFENMIYMEFNTLSDIKANLQNAVDDAYESSQNSSSGGGSSRPSGGGGVSISSSVSANTGYDSSVNVQENADAENVKKAYIIPTLPSDAASSFYDLPESHWAYKAISSLYTAGFVSGYGDGSFCPDAQITRAEFAKMIVALFSMTGSSDTTFYDVAPNSWYADYVNSAVANGLINGYDGKFNPDSAITRQDAVLIAYRAAQTMDVVYSGTYSFEDMSSVAAYAWPAVYSMAACGIIKGDSANRFNPQNSITRAETVQLLFRLAEDIASQK